MTREEAIKHIITYAYYDDDIPLQVATALDMAILPFAPSRSKRASQRTDGSACRIGCRRLAGMWSA